MELSDLRGIGAIRLQALHAAGIHSLRDLLYTVPYRYLDMGAICAAKDARGGATQAFRLTRTTAPKVFYHGGLARIACTLADDTGEITGTWFNQPWMRDVLLKKDTFLLYGRVERTAKTVRLINPRLEESLRIVPVYRAIEGIPNKTRETLIRQALDGRGAHLRRPAAGGGFRAVRAAALRLRHPHSASAGYHGKRGGGAKARGL